MKLNRKNILKTSTILSAIGILALLLLIAFSINSEITGKAVKQQTIEGAGKQVIVTAENFPVLLQNSQIVKDLPKDASLSIRFYDFDTGERQWDSSYLITGNTVKRLQNPAQDTSEEGTGVGTKADIEIIMHSKYLPGIQDLCSTIKKAKANNDVALDTNLNTAKFLWKYRNLMKYKGCFGV